MTLPGPRLLRGVLAGSGAVALITGTLVAVRGPAGIPGGAPTAASNDSVLRFYAVWWARQGAAMWRLSRDPALPKHQLDAVCATTLLGGVARLAAVRQPGRPHPLFQALTVTELVLPPVLVAARRRWQG